MIRPYTPAKSWLTPPAIAPARTSMEVKESYRYHRSWHLPRLKIFRR